MLTNTEYLQEAERIANWFIDRGQDGFTQPDFDKAFKSEFTSRAQQNRLLKKTRDAYFNKVARVKKEDTFKRAGGKNLSQDRLKTSQNIAQTVDEYIQKTAQKSDYPNLDSSPQDIFGKIKGKIVKVKAYKIKFKNKTVTRYRDKRGRFTKLIE